MAAKTKIWYNYWHKGLPQKEPDYIDFKNYLWAQNLMEIKDDLINEVEKFIDKKQTLRSHYYGNTLGVNENWRTLSFKTWNIIVKDNLNECPIIKKWLKNNPSVISASVNLLGPKSTIGKHRGDTNAIYRCHLGIDIPDKIPQCGFDVEGNKKSWKRGELLVFCDAKEHYAWNNTDKPRIIFLFDVIREEFAVKLNSISINVRAFLLLQYLVVKYKWLGKFPKWIHRIIFWKIKIILWIIYPYQKKRGVFLKH